MSRTDHYHDGKGRYTGPLKTKTDYPPSPFGPDDFCLICGRHFIDSRGHADDCPHHESDPSALR